MDVPALCRRLQARREEIEAALLARVYGIADPTEVADLSYLEGIRTATSAAFDFALATLECPSDHPPPLPPALLFQARLAARSGIGLDTILRRYTAGHGLLVDFLIEETEGEVVQAPGLRSLLVRVSSAFDRLLAAVSDEHARELRSRPSFSRGRRRVEKVERLLAGEPVDCDGLAYDFDAWHLGLVVNGEDGRGQLQALGSGMDLRLLTVEPRPGITWAWLGSERRIGTAQAIDRARRCLSGLRLGCGEPAAGLEGWRLTHRQAKAVLPLARGGDPAISRYAEDGLLAAVGKDQVLIDSLRALYVKPLREQKGGEALHRTLRAYFGTNGNISSAAAALDVHRQTLTSRLRTVEETLGRSLNECGVELTVALRLGLFGQEEPPPLDRNDNSSIPPGADRHIAMAPGNPRREHRRN